MPQVRSYDDRPVLRQTHIGLETVDAGSPCVTEGSQRVLILLVSAAPVPQHDGPGLCERKGGTQQQDDDG